MVFVDEPIDFEVTEEDIARGEQRNCLTCPAALAIGRAAGEGSTVMVSTSTVRINNDVYQSPARLIGFVRRVDLGLPVEPFKGRLTMRAA